MKTLKGLLTILYAWAVGVALAVEPFEFALLTDIHLSTHNNTPLQDLTASIDRINESEKVAFVLVSGDITDSGDKASMEIAKAQLDRLTAPYYVTSGNHETKWSSSGCTDFAKVFGSNRFCFTYHNCCFIGLNSGPVIKMSDGHIAPQDIDWLRAQLKALSDSTLVFPVTHYPLQTGDVDNWYELTDVLRQYPVPCILGGHYHRNLMFNCDGIPDVLCRSNLRAKQPAGGFTTIQVNQDSVLFFENKIGEAPAQWLALPLRTMPYAPSDESLRPDFGVNQQYPQAQIRWQTPLRYALYGAPTLYNGQLFIGDDEGHFYALDAQTGAVNWTFQTAGRIVSTACVSEGKVIFGSVDGSVYALSAPTGQLIWRFETSAPVMGCPVANEGVVYIGNSAGQLLALHLDNGQELWRFEGASNYIETRPLIYHNRLYFGAWDTYFYCLDLQTGAQLWKWSNGSKNEKYSPAAVWPVGAENRVFFVAPDRYLTALDAETGALVWRTKAHQVRETIGLSEDQHTLFSRCMNDSVLAFNPSSNTPALVWGTDAHFGYDHNPSMLIEKDGIVVFGTKNGLLLGIEAKTGRVVWQHKIGNSVLNTVTLPSRSCCYVSSAEGTVTCLSIDPSY